MLRDIWIYQGIQQLYVEEQRYILFAIVQARFPRIEALVQQLIVNKNERELLQKLIIRIGSARLEKDARESISNLMREYVSS